MSNAADLGSSSIGGNFVYSGYGGTYSATATTNDGYQGSAFQTYGGLANNQAGVQAQNAIQSTNLFQSYGGYAAAYGGVPAAVTPVDPNSNKVLASLMDNQPPLTWPKDQQIYYKLVGYNTNTQTFETWIIVENIVSRTETFDPTHNFPNIDYGVFFTPPSGNQLSNIKIVGRWIQ